MKHRLSINFVIKSFGISFGENFTSSRKKFDDEKNKVSHCGEHGEGERRGFGMNGHTERYIFPRGTSRVSRALRAAAANESVSALAEGLFEIRMRDTSAITFM